MVGGFLHVNLLPQMTTATGNYVYVYLVSEWELPHNLFLFMLTFVSGTLKPLGLASKFSSPHGLPMDVLHLFYVVACFHGRPAAKHCHPASTSPVYVISWLYISGLPSSSSSYQCHVIIRVILYPLSRGSSTFLY